MSDHPDLAGRIAELHRLDADRRERQRRHYDQTGGECSCPACQADGPVPLAGVVDDLMDALGAEGAGK